jgi:glycosyltransferase involved in cell wall biosynthesis
MISIIIPVYNQATSLGRVLASIWAQTFTDYEVIIVDDGSAAQICDQVSQFEISNSKMQCFRIVHGGANRARNYGFSKCQGEYVIFWDADVVARRNMLQAMEKALSGHSGASYAYSSHYYSWKSFKLWPFDPYRLRQMPYIHTTSLIRREHFPGFDEAINRLQDWDLWLTMLEQGHSGLFIPEFLFKVLPGGTMSSWLPRFFYKLPWKTKQVKEYDQAVRIIKEKHAI